VGWNPKAWIQTSREFLGEVRTEARKVTWPSQKEYTGGTIGVLVIVTIVTAVLGMVDFGLSRAIGLLMP
jgi:preprotein translocase subunit SecE